MAGDGALQSPQNRTLYIGGHKIDGRSKGSYVTLAKADQISVDVGVDGIGVFIDNGDNSATITVSLMPNSKSNDVLSALHTSKLAVPVVLNEKNGTTVGSCARAMVVKHADLTWSDGSETRVWTLVTTNWQGITGSMDPVELNTSI